MAEVERRRRRVRRPSLPADGSQLPDNPASAETSVVHDPQDPLAAGRNDDNGTILDHSNSAVFGPGNGAIVGNGDERETERGLRGLVGSGASQVSPTAAMRARDAARPRETDMAAAERELTIIRRGWVPREELPRNLR